MHSYADSFEQPSVVKIGDKEVTLPVLSQRDLLPWIEEETKKRQETARKNAPLAAAKDNARTRWMDWADNMEVTPGDLQPLVFRASGTIRVLDLSLKKAGVTESDATAFIDGQSAKANEMLAVRVSGLFRREEIAVMYPTDQEKKETPDPNALTPANPGNDQTGRSSAA